MMKAIQTMAGIAFAAVFSTLFLSVALAAPEGLQKRTIQKTLPPEIAQQLRGKPAATFQLADQPVGAGTVILGDDFEGAFPGSWDVFDNDGAVNGEVFWAQTTFRANSGSQSVYGAGGGANAVGEGGPYAHNMDSWMVYGPFDLSDASSASWSFNLWLDSLDQDFIWFLTSTDGANFGGSGFTGFSNGWFLHTVDLGGESLIGEPQVWIAFIFDSDGANSAEGAYIDDVLLEKEIGAITADLALQAIDVGDGVYGPASPIQIQTEVQNVGDSASPAWTISYYMSLDTTITNADIYLGSLTGLPSLSPAESTRFTANGQLPDVIDNNDYFIGAIIDTADADLSNNTNHDATAITVTTDPDIGVRPNDITIEKQAETPGENVAGITTGQTAVLPKAEVLPDLLALAEDKGSVGVIIGFDMAFTPEGHLNAAGRQSQRAAIQREQARLAANMQGLKFTEKVRYEFIPYMALRVDNNALRALVNNPDIRSIEEDRLAVPMMASSNVVIGSSLAWAGGFDGAGQAVAVLDTGVFTSHPYFTTGGSRVIAEACYSTGQAGVSNSLCPGGVASSTDPGSGINCPLSLPGCDHGTHVSGSVMGNDGAGPNYGVARGANLIAMQVFSEFTTDSNCGAGQAPCVASYSSDQLQALQRVQALSASHDIAAINLSLGGGIFSDQVSCDTANSSYKAAIDSLASLGIATVIAAGNNGWTDSTSSPGCISTAITVGATTDADQVAGFSNIASFIDFLAPGTSITSSVPGGIGVKQGTSMSTPHVAGAWAVLKQFSPAASVGAVQRALEASATLVDDERAGGNVTGMRRINVDLALDQLGQAPDSFDIFNNGFGPLNVTSMAPDQAAPWLSLNAAAPFTVLPGQVKVVSIIVDFDSAPSGTTNLRIVIESNDPDESPYPDGVDLTVINTADDVLHADGFENIIPLP